MTVFFDKNVFYSYEKANAFVKIDNSNCDLKVKEVEFQIVQKLKITSSAKGEGFFGSTESFKFDVLENKDKAGIPAKHESLTEKSYELDLGKISYAVNPT
eukprot:CAMPEP_0168624012 /NCGR_PEP_ID=MMETSP0449_2-20121227/9160_1 /TAXON_ID=1082188 /ORGANISM="Strombidium rassoulzadegani, Strain ras09" /LENGTH=99 /DNA_ID=CAMNT_0008665489 /DNA_START=154 /DNA_END=449 /DNA_ORIENTATION=-